MHEVTLPKLSNTMEMGQIAGWRIREGDPVAKGEVIAEIETDKAMVEMESPEEGVLLKIVHGEGAEVEVGTVIAYIGTAGEVPPTEEKAPAAGKAPAAAAASAAPTATTPQAAKPTAEVSPGRVSISPAARKLAEEKGIDPAQIRGSGPGGRITTDDIEKAAASRAVTAPATAPATRPAGDEGLPAIEFTSEEADLEKVAFRTMAMVRRVIAAKQEIPHFYMSASVDVTALMARKDELKSAHGATVTHLIMLACVRALHAHPEVNRSYDARGIVRWKHVNLGLAIDTPKGLTVGVIPRAETLSLAALVRETQTLVDGAKAGELSAEQRRNPTFTISNLGMFGVEDFAPIINPPSSVTMAVAAVLDKPVVRDGRLEVGKVMNLTLSCDHRALDGATAARFLKDLRGLLENPEQLLAGV